MNPTDEIPADLARAVRHAAAAVPDSGHSLAAVHRRRRLHQRHRTAAVAGIVTVAVAAGAAGVPLLVNDARPEPYATASATADAATGGQRLFLAGGATANLEAPPGLNGFLSINGPQGIQEVDAGGTLTTHPVVGVDRTDAVVALPDGRLVVLGSRGGSPVDPGLDKPGWSYVLTLGTTYSANVRVGAEQLQLLGATAEGAYLLRNRQRLVFHEFATGDERPLAAATAAWAAAGRPIDAYATIVRGRSLVFHSVTGGQRIHVIDLDTGADIDRPLPAGDYFVHAVALSPDGRTVAVGVRTVGDDGAGEYRLISVDVAGGAPREQTVAAVGARSTGGLLLGLAFTDDHAVRVAYMEFPADDAQVFDPAKVVKVRTVRV